MNNDRNKKLTTCTDIPWLLLFFMFWILLIAIAVYSFKYRSYDVIVKGYDSFGNVCGSKHNRPYENVSLSAMDTYTKPYLFFMNNTNISTVLKICVEECTFNEIPSKWDLFQFWKETRSMLCQYDFDIYDLNRLIAFDTNFEGPFGPCPVTKIFKSTTYRHRCIPILGRNVSKDIYTARAVSGKEQFGEMFFIASYLSWPYVLALIGIAIFISITLWAIINYLSHIICWITYCLVIFCNAGVYLIVLREYHKKPMEYNAINPIDVKTVQYYLLEEAIVNRKILSLLTAISSCSMIILFFVLVFLRKYFSEITLLWNETINFLKKSKSLAIVPLIAILLMVVVLSFWSYVMLCLTTASYPKVSWQIGKNKEDQSGLIDKRNKGFNKVEYVEDNYCRNLIWIYILGYLWITEFIIAGEQFIVGFSIIHIYFPLPGNSSKGKFLWQLIRYHLGTIAKGSFLFTFCKLPQLVVLKAGGKIVKKFISNACILNRIDWLEKNIVYFSPVAYILVAMDKINLSPAGRKTWHIMGKTGDQLNDINSMTFFIIFLVKLTVSLFTIIAGIHLVNNIDGVHLFMAPVILSTVFAYCLANTVFSFLEMTLDAICLCVCEDSRINSYAGRCTKSNLEFLLKQNRTENQQAPVAIIKTCW